MKYLQRTCKEAAALMVAREDRKLPVSDQLALRLHLAICKACPRFERQMLLLRKGMKQWRNYSDPET